MTDDTRPLGRILYLVDATIRAGKQRGWMSIVRDGVPILLGYFRHLCLHKGRTFEFAGERYESFTPSRQLDEANIGAA